MNVMNKTGMVINYPIDDNVIHSNDKKDDIINKHD